jgi:hypothetical protein
MSEQEIAVIDKIRIEYNLKIEEACFSKGYIPRYIILDKSRNIHSYIVPCYISGKKLISSYWMNLRFEETILQFLKIQYSHLDRPLFFAYIYQNNIMIIEGDDVKNYLCNEKSPDLLMDYMIENSYNFSETFKLIKQEL